MFVWFSRFFASSSRVQELSRKISQRTNFLRLVYPWRAEEKIPKHQKRENFLRRMFLKSQLFTSTSYTQCELLIPPPNVFKAHLTPCDVCSRGKPPPLLRFFKNNIIRCLISEKHNISRLWLRNEFSSSKNTRWSESKLSSTPSRADLRRSPNPVRYYELIPCLR